MNLSFVCSALTLALGFLEVNLQKPKFNAARNREGQKVSPPSGAKFHKMTASDAAWYKASVENGTVNLTPYGAIVVASKICGVNHKDVTAFVKKTLNVGKIGQWNEGVSSAETLAGIGYCRDVAACRQ